MAKMKNHKKYTTKEEKDNLNANEPISSYSQSSHSSFIPTQNSDIDTLFLIKKGIPKKNLDKTIKMMSFSLDEMAVLLHVSERTLRRYDDHTILNTEQSERIIELNNLYSYGNEVFGDASKFKQWIESPIMALGNLKPKEFLDTSLGIRMLKNILSRIEYGVYS